MPASSNMERFLLRGVHPQLWSIFLAYTIIIMGSHVQTVDRSNFKTCEQSAFCRRNRNIPPGESNWNLLVHTLEKKIDGVEIQLEHAKTHALMKMVFTSVFTDGQAFRMKITELRSPRPRYEATESLLGDIAFSKIDVLSIDDNVLRMAFGEDSKRHKAIVNVKPFRIDIYNGDDLVISGNARGLFKFEHWRPRPGREDDDEENAANHAGDEEVDQTDGAWTESFKSWTDSKPHGPMSVGMDFSFVGFDHVYGIPEHADSFALKNTKGVSDPYRLYNLDVFEYELDSPMALYGSNPTMIAHSEKYTLGMLWLNPSETWIDIESTNLGVLGILSNLVSGDTRSRLTHWYSETGIVDVWFMLGPKPSDVMRQNAMITGTTQLPPYYSIGYHQSRWNYFTQDEVSDVDEHFDQHDIPVDSLWLDIEYTEGRSKKYFTWDPITFSDPKLLTSNLTSKGRRLITIIDPHIKKDTHYPVYNEGVENNYFIKNTEGNDYEGWCWPGASMYADFVNPTVGNWWSNKFNPEFFPGFHGGIVDIWNDMNEPSVFNGPEITAPKDLQHHGGLEHRDVHNMYGYLMVKSTYTGLVTHRSNLRPFILSRAFFVGGQRYSAIWTGDNISKWSHLRATIPMILSLSVVGISFSGADVPGFFENPPSEELVVRWYQAAAFQPFFRGHAHLDTRRREPWLFSERSKLLIRSALRTRYTYLPFMYTLFHENTATGMPIIRPLWFHFPSDSKGYAVENAHLLGSSLLVQPVMEEKATKVSIYFPGNDSDIWYDTKSKTAYEGGKSVDVDVDLSTIPYYQRGGTIIPKRERIRRSAALTLKDPISFEIVLDSDGYAFGTSYIDDGYTFNYKSGSFIYSNITISNDKITYRIMDGSFETPVWVERITIFKFTKNPTQIDATCGSAALNLQYKYDSDKQILIIRKPTLNLGKTWEINIGT